MACYCCVSGCKNNNHKKTSKHFFRFPKNDSKRHNLWRRFSRKNVKTTAVICEDHFDPRYLVQKDKKLKLSNDAVPTIFYKTYEDGFEKVFIQFNGDDYFGAEADEMNRASDESKDQEIVAIETAFVNEQFMLEELKIRCRFCAEPKEELIDMTSFSIYNIDLSTFFRSLNLHITESDFFPSSVCEECFNQVMLIDTFVVKCKGADQWLFNEIGKLKTITAALPTSENEMKIEHNDADEKKDQDRMDESYRDIIQECESENEGSKEDSPLFTISYDKKHLGLSNLEDSHTKPTSKKVPEYAIMDPSCNKFAMRSYNCEVCLKTFAGLKTYKTHICDVPEIRCTECSDTFQTVFALKSHRRQLHSGNDEKSYCSICKTVITGKLADFKKHKTKCNRERIVGNIRCDPCQKTFSTLHSLTVHQMFHDKAQKTADEDVLAPDSPRQTKRKSDVICELCGKVYTTIGDCRRHIKLKHTEITEIFSCDICNKNYPSKSVLKDHFRNTHVVNEAPCTFCGKVFRNKTHLKKHMVYHDASKKVHKCSICPGQPGFVNKVGLIRHQAKHANQDNKGNYNCEICVNYNFHTNLQLKSHLKHVHGIDQL